MISIINLNNIVEKELELERHGFRRTRRWIGDASQVTNEEWYQTRLNQVALYQDKLNKLSKTAEITPSRQARTLFWSRLSNLFSTPRQPASSKT